jgi:pimeloyl-ACP methyl ester carboxylesterase
VARPAPLLLALALLLTGCGGGSRTTRPSTTASKPAATVWLCRPGLANDPCTSSLTATVLRPSGAGRVERATAAANPPVDCFYVYPTVSAEQTVNANRRIGLREREVAIAQASRFSQVCRVFAPVYRQVTLAALAHPQRITLANALLAYDDVEHAFDDYLAHDNHGRGIVLVGHSQGAIILTRLVARRIDPDPALRRKLVSAFLLGGNVTTDDFRHVPPCRSRTQTGCVVAYSSFTSAPAPDSQFGRTDSNAGVGLLTPAPGADARIVCVNPAAPAGGRHELEPYLPTLAFVLSGSPVAATTPWVGYAGGYTGQCESSGNATWLQVDHAAAARDQRPDLTGFNGAVLGLHLLDVNVALGDLVGLARDQAAAYVRR